MCSIAPNPLRLQCAEAALLSASIKVGIRLPNVLLISRSQVGSTLRASQARSRNLVCSQNRQSQRCRAQADEGDTPEISFTNHSEDFNNEDSEESFFNRLLRAWAILFPTKAKPSTNAEIAKQRLKMILISDRCSVNDEAKRRIVTNIVGALSDFVEIESEEKVQLNVSSDSDLGTVYSVTVPVRRVRPEYQEFSKDLVNTELRSFDFQEQEGNFKMVDIRFQHPDVEEEQG